MKLKLMPSGPEQQAWLSEQIKKLHLVEVPTNPLIAVFGPGPGGARCKTCRHLFCNERSRRYYKCDLRRCSHGPATDHRINWPACGKYEPVKAPGGAGAASSGTG